MQKIRKTFQGGSILKLKKNTIRKLVLIILVLTLIQVFEPKSIFKTASGSNNNFSPRTIYWGNTGEDVKVLQNKLLRWKYYDGWIDGIYGARTYRAIRRFQEKNGLNVDGIVGPSTAKALGMPVQAAGGNDGGINTKSEEYMLARTIHGEARGEPYVGKVAVAAVVLNRTKSPSFPNTVAGVVYQPLAFTAVADGQINLTPNKDAIKAARDALNGWDPTYGCLYYWNPITATSKWIWSRKVTLKIGKHWFGI